MKLRKMITNLFVEKGDTKSDRDLIYMKPLNYALKKVLEYYFDSGKKILDVTAGERRIWNPTTLFNTDLDGKKIYDVTFLDVSLKAKLDVQGDFRHLPFKENSFDIIIIDVPFIQLATGIESFGIKTHKTPDRPFYFRQSKQWIPPEAYFFQTWKEMNRVSRNGLIVKISERYENLREIPVLTYLDLAYDETFNKSSKFKRCVNISYRGKRAGLGATMIHAQRVLSHYVVFKKDLRLR